LASLIEKLMLLESTVGEEYYILVQLKTLQYMTREIREIYNVDLEDLKDILETIIRDEETQRTLVKNEKDPCRRRKADRRYSASSQVQKSGLMVKVNT